MIVDKRIPSGSKVKLTLIRSSILHNVDTPITLGDLTSLLIEQYLVVIPIDII